MRLLLISVIQSVLLCGGQVLLKLAMQRAGAFSWSLDFLSRNLTNWWLLACGICYGAATLLWLYIIKNFPFSMAYLDGLSDDLAELCVWHVRRHPLLP